MKEQMDCNESVIIMSAVRYMVERGSYGVGCVIDYVKRHKNRLTNSTKQVIVRDITDYVRENPDMRYKKDWLDLIDYLINK